MIKNSVLFLLLIFSGTFIVASTTHACDPLGCLTIGHNQDTLILGEVVAVKQDSQDMKIIYVFPQNKIPSVKAGDQITVADLQNAMNQIDDKTPLIAIGKKYLMSLNKKDSLFVPAWGIYEVTGTTYSDAKLIKVRDADHAALQVLMNSGGTESDFYFIGEKAFLRAKDGKSDIQIYPTFDQAGYDKNLTYSKERNTILLYGAVAGVLVILGGSAFVIKIIKSKI